MLNIHLSRNLPTTFNSYAIIMAAAKKRLDANAQLSRIFEDAFEAAMEIPFPADKVRLPHKPF